MVFSSIIFLFRFMPVAFLIYYLIPKRFKNLALFVLSLIFYAWGEPKYIPIMLASTIVDYLAALGIRRWRNSKAICRLFLGVSLFFNLGMLIFFKYTNFILENVNALLGVAIPYLAISLPLGISFYTFQTLSYTIDVYRGKAEAESNFINFGAFVVLFPQLIAGPIVKYTDISAELKNRTINLPQIEDGIRLFIMGLGSKVLIANNIGALWTEVEKLGFEAISTPLAWLGIIAFSLQIYFDFSGYSLMAIGLGRMLGFNFPQNFNFPYIAKSVTDFWRRWHMTLSSWFREYVYIPLGGNRVKPGRMYFNLLVVWAATGIWHGASWNFLFWGLWFFVLLAVEKLFLLKYLEKSKIISRVYLILVVLLSWALFAITNMEQLGIFLSKMFSFTGGLDWQYYLKNYAVSLVLGIFFATPVVKIWYERIQHIKVVKIAVCAVVLVLSVAYLVDATYNPFLYFRF